MSEQSQDRVVISDQPVVDFSHLTSPEQLAVIREIKDVALVIVPESLAAAYAENHRYPEAADAQRKALNELPPGKPGEQRCRTSNSTRSRSG